MAEVASDEGSRRRLPSWMLGAAVSKQAMRLSDRDECNKNAEEGLPSKDNEEPGKALVFGEKEALGISKCKRKTGKRKSTPAEYEGDVTDLDKNQYQGLGRRALESRPNRKRKARSIGCADGKDLEIQPDQDLTVEDLLSIAKEYVEAGKDIGQKKSSNKECQLVSESPRTASFENGLGDSLIAFDSNLRSPVHERTDCSTLKLISEQDLANARRTGDPAQDMLDLFLGPLLKKPAQEKKTEFAMEDMEVAYKSRKPSQSDVGEEIFPLNKKKSSLRDKVSMLLD